MQNCYLTGIKLDGTLRISIDKSPTNKDETRRFKKFKNFYTWGERQKRVTLSPLQKQSDEVMSLICQVKQKQYTQSRTPTAVRKTKKITINTTPQMKTGKFVKLVVPRQQLDWLEFIFQQ